jgi:hypothetical protein
VRRLQEALVCPVNSGLDGVAETAVVKVFEDVLNGAELKPTANSSVSSLRFI